MKAIDRLYQYFDNQNIKPTRFEKDYGFSNGYFGTQRRRNANLGEDVLVKIINNCLHLDPLWLITGKGEMLQRESSPTTQKPLKAGEPISAYTKKLATPQCNDPEYVKKEVFDDLLENIAELNRRIGALEYQLDQAKKGK